MITVVTQRKWPKTLRKAEKSIWIAKYRSQLFNFLEDYDNQCVKYQ
jgi:hypothetical protein